MESLGYQEILNYSQNSKLQVSVNPGGNVVMVPMNQLEPRSPTDSLSQHVTTHIITPEQLQQATGSTESSSYQQNQNQTDLELDENLADLQPEDSDEDEGQNEILSPQQQKLEFMAAVNLVPPAVLEEIQRRQKLCRAEYGNWWDRQHSTDFCLVPKSSSALTNIHNISEEQHTTQVYDDEDRYPLMTVGEDQTQVAAGPDAESMVEQITYLTSWPATSSPVTPHPNTVEVVTTPTTAGMISGGHVHQLQHMMGSGGNMEEGYQITFPSINEYSNSSNT